MSLSPQELSQDSSTFFLSLYLYTQWVNKRLYLISVKNSIFLTDSISMYFYNTFLCLPVLFKNMLIQMNRWYVILQLWFKLFNIRSGFGKEDETCCMGSYINNVAEARKKYKEVFHEESLSSSSVYRWMKKFLIIEISMNEM